MEYLNIMLQNQIFSRTHISMHSQIHMHAHKHFITCACQSCADGIICISIIAGTSPLRNRNEAVKCGDRQPTQDNVGGYAVEVKHQSPCIICNRSPCVGWRIRVRDHRGDDWAAIDTEGVGVAHTCH